MSQRLSPADDLLDHVVSQRLSHAGATTSAPSSPVVSPSTLSAPARPERPERWSGDHSTGPRPASLSPEGRARADRSPEDRPEHVRKREQVLRAQKKNRAALEDQQQSGAQVRAASRSPGGGGPRGGAGTSATVPVRRDGEKRRDASLGSPTRRPGTMPAVQQPQAVSSPTHGPLLTRQADGGLRYPNPAQQSRYDKSLLARSHLTTGGNTSTAVWDPEVSASRERMQQGRPGEWDWRETQREMVIARQQQAQERGRTGLVVRTEDISSGTSPQDGADSMVSAEIISQQASSRGRSVEPELVGRRSKDSWEDRQDQRGSEPYFGEGSPPTAGYFGEGAVGERPAPPPVAPPGGAGAIGPGIGLAGAPTAAPIQTAPARSPFGQRAPAGPPYGASPYSTTSPPTTAQQQQRVSPPEQQELERMKQVARDARKRARRKAEGRETAATSAQHGAQQSQRAGAYGGSPTTPTPPAGRILGGARAGPYGPASSPQPGGGLGATSPVDRGGGAALPGTGRP